MKPNLIHLIPALEGEELVYLQHLTQDLTETQLQNFIAIYNGKRRQTLPSVAPAEYKCLGYGINAQDKHFNPFMFIKKDGKYIIRMLDI